jgi:hypothetical protein
LPAQPASRRSGDDSPTLWPLRLAPGTTRWAYAIRATTDRTIRAQARSIYAKAGLTGRAALSAFFLEDLLSPIDTLK